MSPPIRFFRGFNDESAAMDPKKRSAAINGVILKCAVRTRTMEQCAKLANEIYVVSEWNVESVQSRLSSLQKLSLKFHESNGWQEDNIDKWLKDKRVADYVGEKVRAWERRKEIMEGEEISSRMQEDADLATGKHYQFVPYRPEQGRQANATSHHT